MKIKSNGLYKAFSVLALTLLMLFYSGVLAFAAAEPVRLVDDAGLLGSSEYSSLRQKLDDISNKWELDIVIVTVDTLGAKTPTEYADDYYDYNGFRDDGILFLISMQERDWAISTKGYGITAFTDAGQEYIIDSIISSLSDGSYDSAFNDFADLCDKFIDKAKSGTPYDSGNLPRNYFSVTGLLIALGGGLILSLIIVSSMKSKLKTIRPQQQADAYIDGALSLSRSNDVFLYRHVSRIKKETHNSSRGSSTHRSSSGSSHGGSSGKF